MLSREKRLRRERDITRVYHKGRYGGGSNIQVKALATGYPASRAAIVVSKKVSKQAVTRNRIKRRLAAQLAAMWQTVTPGCDIVVTVRADVSKLHSDDLAKELLFALTRAGALTKPTKGEHV